MSHAGPQPSEASLAVKASAGTQQALWAKFEQGHGTSTGLYVGLWIFFLFLYLRPQDLIPSLSQVRPVVVLMVLLSISFLLSKSKSSSTVYVQAPFFKTLLVFFATMVWSIPFSYYRQASFDASLDFLKVVIACLLIINIVDSFKRVQNVFLLIISTLAIFAVDVGKKYIAGLSHDEVIGLVGGQFENPNDLAVNFVLFLPMVYYYAIVSKTIFLKLASLGLFVLILFGILGCQSRGGMLAAAIVVVLLFLKTEKKVLTLVAISMVIAVVLVLAPNNAAFERLETVLNYKEEGSAYSRTLFYKSSIRMMLERPLTGVGINAFQTAYAADYRHPEDKSYRWPDPHSNYFQIMAELGIPGMSVYLYLLYLTFRSLKRLENDYRSRAGCERQRSFVQCLKIGLIGFLFATIFQSFSYYHTLYNVMALVCALERLSSVNVGEPATLTGLGFGYATKT